MVEGSLSNGKRQRLAALAAATADALLVIFVLAVALPLLPPKLADPFWLLAFTGTFCTKGYLALLAVLLLQMAAALEPQSVWHQSRRLLVRRCSRAVMVVFCCFFHCRASRPGICGERPAQHPAVPAGSSAAVAGWQHPARAAKPTQEQPVMGQHLD